MAFKAPIWIPAVLAGATFIAQPIDARTLYAQHGQPPNSAAVSHPSNANIGVLLMADNNNISASSTASSSATASTSGSVQNDATNSRDAVCSASAKAVADVNGQRKIADDQKTMRGSGNGCKATARARAVVKPEHLPED